MFVVLPTTPAVANSFSCDITLQLQEWLLNLLHVWGLACKTQEINVLHNVNNLKKINSILINKIYMQDCLKKFDNLYSIEVIYNIQFFLANLQHLKVYSDRNILPNANKFYISNKYL